MATHGHSDARCKQQQKMQTHGHSDARCKQQKMQMMERQLPNKKFMNYLPNDIFVEFLSLLRSAKSKFNYYIPNDIVVEILSRLPAKSLIRLRWTCKYWFDLITRDHDFIKMHLHATTTHDELFSIISPSVLSTESTNYCLNYSYATMNPSLLSTNYVGEIFQCYLNYSDRTTMYEVGEIFQCYLNYSDRTTMYEVGVVPNEVSIALPNDHRPLESSFKTYNVCGSCNGLILLEDYDLQKLCIWNPCTREYKNLPRPLDVDGRRWMLGGYGFGYDQTTNDYKVIRNVESQAQVYTLGTNAWRWIGPNPYLLSCMTTIQGFWDFRRIFAEGVFVNGALYWMDSLHKNIISFDIGKEKFKHVSKLPNVIDHDEKWYNVKLQVFEGSLCMVLKIKEEQNYCAEMWVLKDYTVNDNNNNEESLWAKLITIPNLCDVVFPIKTLRYIRNGEILMLNNHNVLFLYDPKKNKTRTLGRISVHHVNKVYLESLVCLNSGTFTPDKARKEQTITTEEAREEQTMNEIPNKDKELNFSFISNQNKIVFREYMRRSLSNQNKKKIVFKEKIWQGRRHC